MAHAGLDDRAVAQDDLWARGSVRAEKPAPALLLARFGQYGDGPEILLGRRRQPALPRPDILCEEEFRDRLIIAHRLLGEGGLHINRARRLIDANNLRHDRLQRGEARDRQSTRLTSSPEVEYRMPA